MDRIEVARFTTLPEAELATALLRRHAIDANVADREMANTMPHLQTALGGLRVVVPDDQVAHAREILRRAGDGAFAPDDEDDDGEWRQDAIPGKVGELDEREIQGVIGNTYSFRRIIIIAVLLGPPILMALLLLVT